MKINSINKFKTQYYDRCQLCANRCNINREKQKGLCNAGNHLQIASAVLHFGEEPPISGCNGSGTIFFSNCSLKCEYCQNYPISQFGVGNTFSDEELANKMLKLQKTGAHNINLVTPTHYIVNIIEAIEIAKKKGLSIPIVYNTSSYENSKIIDYIDNYIDIYLADIRYSNNSDALLYSKVKNYKKTVYENILKFYKKKGNLKIKNGIAYRGLLIRVLILPSKTNEAMNIIDFVYKNMGRDVYMSIMNQFFPYYNSKDYPKINRTLYYNEYKEIIDYVNDKKMKNIFIQEFSEMEVKCSL